ncbi:MAG: hypothetical protein HRT44_03480, partial [Bdellovibrionales bacterium]|nr:hypothetical protein [Bdellovibrionales bacterium]NQZ18307.1 hypothetical protein [Bdellovibrionales bacterium]
QESYWTQYRLNEEDRLLLMRGDNNHGYGFMQIDDRSHEEFLHTGNIFDLKEHLIYAMDLLYSLRRSVRRKPCKKALGYTKQNRSIYSSYNGGLGSKCRWKNPGSKWARNDKGFLAKYRLRAWTEFVPLTPLIIDDIVHPNASEEPPSDEVVLPDEVPIPTFRPTEDDVPGTNNMDAVRQSMEGEDDEQGVDSEADEDPVEDDVIPEDPDEMDPRQGAY